MILKDFYEELFEKEHVRLQKIIECCEEQEDELPTEVLKLVAHIINTQHIWLNHLKSQKAESAFWDLPPLHFFQRLNNQNLIEIKDFLAKEVLLQSNQKLHFEENCQKRIMDVLHYMLEHAAYHRGQIIFILKNHRLKIPAIQFLAFD